MQHHDSSLDEDVREQTALYAIGALPEVQRRAFEEHLATGCEACQTELNKWSPVVAALTDGVKPVAAMPATRAALLARVRAAAKPSPLRRHLQLNEAGDGANEMFVNRAAESVWQDSDVPGVRIRVLYTDAPRNQFSALVRMAPGASYPRHVHGGPEECLVLEGDLRLGREVFGPGDYQRAPTGSSHDVQRTEHGCLLLINSSLTDRFV
jgi:anti-sigma factor ChrR (cupin superfamily)